VVEAAGKAGRPMVVVEDHYGGPYSLGFNGRVETAGWKAVGLATSRIQDVADVVRCFRVLRKPGATADDFLAAAKDVYHKNIARPVDFIFRADQVHVNDIGQCVQKLRESKTLLVGRDPKAAGPAIKEEFGVQVIPIELAELHQAYLKADPAEAAKWADRWIAGAEKVVEPKRDDVVKSGAMHLAMQELMKKHQARAISINCLGGFYGGQLQAYPCLGFVELNNDGFVGACEGDLSSTVTMLAMGYLTDRPGFISDPVIDTATNQIIYAHCVAPTKVFGPKGHRILTISVAIRRIATGGRPLVDALEYLTTTLKFVPGRREVVLHQAISVANVDEDKACRSKLACYVKGDIDKLFSGWQHGWHRVTYYGDLKEPVKELCQTLKIKVVEEA